jgi:transcriptional regulator with XRE-family HTH domain
MVKEQGEMGISTIKLYTYMGDKGMSILDLAVVSGVNVAIISDIVNNRCYPNHVIVEKLATALDVSVADLME